MGNILKMFLQNGWFPIGVSFLTQSIYIPKNPRNKTVWSVRNNGDPKSQQAPVVAFASSHQAPSPRRWKRSLGAWRRSRSAMTPLGRNRRRPKSTRACYVNTLFFWSKIHDLYLTIDYRLKETPLQGGLDGTTQGGFRCFYTLSGF